MAKKIGAAFLPSAFGPLRFAGSCLLASRVKQGLTELSPENLRGAFDRGVETVAKQVDLEAGDILVLLPMGEIEACLVRLGAAQQRALAAWSTFAGHGLMTGIADLTVDSRAPDVSNFLLRIAKKLRLDKPLSEPLVALATEVATWLDLVELCGERLTQGAALAKAYKERQKRVVMVVAAALAVGAVVALVALWVRKSHDRVDHAIASPDPCTVLTLSQSDVNRASFDQQFHVAERRKLCDDATTRGEREQKALEARKQKELEEVERAKAQAERCAILADHLVKGVVDPADAAAAGGKVALFARIAKRELAPEDAAETTLPCANTPAGPQIIDAFANALLAPNSGWTETTNISPFTRDKLIAHKAELTPQATFLLSRRVELIAKKALMFDPSVRAHALEMCGLVRQLSKTGVQKYCDQLIRSKPPR